VTPQKRDPLGKALKLLEAMLQDQDGDWGVGELSEATGLPTTTVHRTLGLLEENGLVRSDSGRYEIGLDFYRIVWQADSHWPVRDITLRHILDLGSEFNEAVYSTVYDPTRLALAFVARSEPSHPLRYLIPLYEWMPIPVGASGLSIMAFLPPIEQERIFEKGIPRMTDNTTTDQEEVKEKLRIIRREGYACTHGERFPGGVGICVPFWGSKGKVVGSLCLTVPDQRYISQQEPEFAGALMRAAHSITTELVGQAATRRTSQRS
jgi:DNA-binding IclR family transcriptional regulator